MSCHLFLYLISHLLNICNNFDVFLILNPFLILQRHELHKCFYNTFLFALSYAVFYFFLSVSLFRQEPVFHIFYKCTGSLWMFDSSHLIFVKQCFLLALFGSWFWCYFCSFRFLCLQLVTLKVVSGSYLRILFNLDTEFPRNHNISLSFARKNIQINVDNSYARNSECLFMHANERRYYRTEFVE